MAQSFLKPIRSENRMLHVRFLAMTVALVLVWGVCVLRLSKLQIVDRQMYQILASDQHDMQSKIQPKRGRIFIRDKSDGQLYPLASNREAWTVYAVPKNMSDPVRVAHELSPALGISDVDLIAKLTKSKDDPYELLAKDVNYDTVLKIKDLHLEGLGFNTREARLYPEKNMGGQIVGLVTPDAQENLVGRYGIESSYQDYLAGRSGTLATEKDAAGRRIIFAEQKFREAVDGTDLVLTLDRGVQYKACEKIRQGVLDYQADSGTVVVMDPKTGAILAMCSYPDFDPSDFRNVTDVSVFNNPAVFTSYEPGSVFKAVTVSSGLEANKINPKTVYEDKGVEKIDDFEIKNSDGKANGLQTMQQVMEKSLNTGTIFVQRQLGKAAFREYVKKFGFGQKTEVGLKPEAAGDISSLDKKGDVFAATASFGQGIMVTPIQLVAAYGAIANQGKLMQPHIISEMIYSDGRRETVQPVVKSQPISPRAARLMTGMLISAVETGHGQKAGVPGYWVAAKTGTAQVAKKNGAGYEEGRIIASMLGYAPADDPKFVMLVKLDNPKAAAWAETSAAPIFGDLAAFILRYYDIAPDREGQH